MTILRSILLGKELMMGFEVVKGEK